MEEKKKKVKQQTNRTGCEPTHTFPCSMVADIKEVVTGMAEVDPVVKLLNITPPIHTKNAGRKCAICITLCRLDALWG